MQVFVIKYLFIFVIKYLFYDIIPHYEIMRDKKKRIDAQTQIQKRHRDAETRRYSRHTGNSVVRLLLVLIQNNT